MKNLLRLTYGLALLLFTIYSLVSCGCPGANNLAYPRFYKAQDLMKYELDVSCMLAKTDSSKEALHEWVGVINGDDDIIFSFEDEELNYFRLMHHDTYENLYQLFGKYIRFFKLYGVNYKYTAGHNFNCTYLTWEVACNWRSETLQVVCTRIN